MGPPMLLHTLIRGLVVLLLAGAAGAAGAQDRIPSHLQERVAAGERVRLIVELDEPAVPEGWLPDPDARLAQRVRIAGARAGLLEALRGSDGERIRPYESLPFVALEAGPDAMARLARFAGVRAVREDRPARPFLNNSVPKIQGDLAHAIGFDGTGQVIVVLDTGVDGGHQNFAGQIVDEACFASGYGVNPNAGDCPGGDEVETGSGSGVPCDYDDDCAPGYHVAGIAGGSGPQYSGVAPGAGLIPIQVFSEFPGTQCPDGQPCPRSWSSDQDLALLYVFNTLRASHDIAAVNMSLGGEVFTDTASCDADRPSTRAAIDQLRSVGIATVVASGNKGCDGTGCLDALATPSCISSAVSVGATRVSDDFPPAFGNRAPFMSLWAPGLNIDAPLYETTDQYVSLSGTSMAAPHVAGAFAVVRQALPAVSVDAALSAFQSTGVDPPFGNGLGVKRVAIRDALTALGITECVDGVDNDGDALIDDADPGCASPADLDEIDPALTCDNGEDDDLDGDVDLDDPGCRDPEWGFEDPECQDGVDNDEDGGTDFEGAPADKECVAWWDNSETPTRCGLGAELALVAAALLAVRRRARRGLELRRPHRLQ